MCTIEKEKKNLVWFYALLLLALCASNKKKKCWRRKKAKERKTKLSLLHCEWPANVYFKCFRQIEWILSLFVSCNFSSIEQLFFVSTFYSKNILKKHGETQRTLSFIYTCVSSSLWFKIVYRKKKTKIKNIICNGKDKFVSLTKDEHIWDIRRKYLTLILFCSN